MSSELFNQSMNKYQSIAVIVVRGFAVSYLVTALIEAGIIAADTLFVKTGIYLHSEIALKPRLIIAAFNLIGSLFLYSQSQPIAKALVQGLTFENDESEIIEISKENEHQADE